MAYLLPKNVITKGPTHGIMLRQLSLSFHIPQTVSRCLCSSTVKLISKEEIQALQGNHEYAMSEEKNNSVPNNESRERSRNAGKFNPPYKMKTKDSFLKEFTETLDKGEVLSTKAAFLFIKSCGPRMVGETDESRNELVDYVWSQLQKNGVDLQTGLWNTLLSVYIENQKDFEPIEFLKNLWETSAAEPNKTTFALLIQAYAVKGDPVGAMKIVDFMMKNDSRMTEHIYAWLIQAFAKNEDMNGVEELLKTMNETGIRPRHTTYGNLINVYAEKGDLDSINKTLLEMIDQKIYPTSEVYVNMLDHLSRGGHFDLLPKVWEKIDDIEYMTDDVKPLIQRCVTRGDYASAIKLIQCSTKKTSSKKESYHFYIERKLFNMLRYSEKNLQEFLKSSEVIEEHFGVSRHSRLHHLLEFFIDKGEIENCVKALKLLPLEVMSPQKFHPLLRSLADKKDVHGMVDVLRAMGEMGVSPDYYCAKIILPSLGEYGSEKYQTFLKLVQEDDKIILPFNVVSNMLESEEEMTLSDLSSIANNASNADLFSSLIGIKQKLISDFNPNDTAKIMITLHERGIRNITVLVDEVLRSFITNCDKEQALEALQFVNTLMEENIPLSSYTYTMILRALHSNGLSDQFFMFVRMMKEHGVDPDVHQYYQMLKMASTVGNSMAAQFCFNKVKDSPEYPDRKHELYDLLIRAYGRDNENSKVLPSYIQGNYSENALKIISLFEEMKALDFRPNPTAVSIIIRSYLLNNDIEGAKDMIENYGEGKEELRKTVQNSFIRAYVANKDFAAAEDLFNTMKSDGTLTSLQYNEMLRMCELTGDVEKSELLYEEMKARGFTPNVFTYLHRIRTYLANKQPEPCIQIIEENIAGENNLRVDIFMVVLRHLVPTGNIESVKKMIELIKEHHNTKVPPKRLDHALSLVHIKAGNIDEASRLLPTQLDGEEDIEIELNPYRKVAKTASTEGDVKYIENMIEFLKRNGLYYQTLDTFYLLALNKAGDVDGIRRLYKERIDEGFEPTEKFIALLTSIIEMRNIPDFEL